MQEKKIHPFTGFSLYLKNKRRNAKVLKRWNSINKKVKYVWVDKDSEPCNFKIEKEKVKL